jgi:hypothetical protein
MEEYGVNEPRRNEVHEGRKEEERKFDFTTRSRSPTS